MNKNEIFTLWISDNGEDALPLLPYLSLKSMVLCGHDVVIYSYSYLTNVPSGVKVVDANQILDNSRIFRYKEGHKTLSGFANLFRLKRLYEFGGTWLDLDILLIRNINEKFNNEVLICSEPTKVFYSKPNNAVLRFPRHDPFVKSMLDYAEKRGDNIVHGETGPTLVGKKLKGEFWKYNQYVKSFNFNNFIQWKYLNDYFKNPNDVLNNIEMNEIVGFHLVNTFFKRILSSKDSNVLFNKGDGVVKDNLFNNHEGLFNILKRIIIQSNSQDEYYYYLRKYNIISRDENNKVKKFDMEYLNIFRDNLDKQFKYTILIDVKNLKKSELYTILHSIGYDSSFDDLMRGNEDTLLDKQIIIFGKTNLPYDKIKFKDNMIFLSSDFGSININKYIYGEYIILINKPIIFEPGFFKDKIISKEIEHYRTNSIDTNINIFDKKIFFELLEVYGSKNIFNLSKDRLNGFDVHVYEKGHIFDYGNCSDKLTELKNLIDYLQDNFDDETFLKVKSKLESLKFINLIDEVSYNYYSSYKNILNSKNCEEFKLNEENVRLDILNSFYLNKLNKNNEI